MKWHQQPQRLVEVGTARIYYQEVGSGRPVVLIHGLSGSGRWWRHNVTALAQHYHVYVIDMIGFGRSRKQPFVLHQAASLLAAWMDQIGIDTADVVGHSMGGFVAVDLAASFPDKVANLVLVDAAALPLGRTHLQHAFGLLRALGEMPLGFLPILIGDALRAGPRTLLNAMRELLTTDISHKLGQIDAPTLLIWGEHDWLVPLAIGQQLCKTLVNASLIVVPKAGHNPMWDRPETFNQIAIDFLQGCAANASVRETA